jgi:hypothetical protein
VNIANNQCPHDTKFVIRFRNTMGVS